VDLVARASTVAGHAVLSFSGEIDLSTVPALHDALTRLVASTEPATAVIVDLDGVYICDDTGLGVLLGAASRARLAGGELVVVCSSGSLRERLAQTRFDRAVTVAPSVEQAVAAPVTSGD
jgi:anti-sigma B factor antagonist